MIFRAGPTHFAVHVPVAHAISVPGGGPLIFIFTLGNDFLAGPMILRLLSQHGFPGVAGSSNIFGKHGFR